MSQSLNNRSYYIDLVKAISIFGVVYIHSSGILKGAPIPNDIIKACLRFGVPCFVLFWAYFIERGLLKRDKYHHFGYLFNKFIELFKVFCIWSAFYLFVSLDFDRLSLRDIIKYHFMGFGWQGQYFFIVLFQLLVLFPLLRWVYKKKALLVILVIAIISIYFFVGYQFSNLPPLIKKIGYSPFSYWIPYVLAGIALARQDWMKINNWQWIVVFLIPIEAIFIILYDMQGFPYVSLGLLIRFLMLSSLAIGLKNQMPKPSVVQNTVGFIAKNTMVVFVANPFLVMLFKYFLQTSEIQLDRGYAILINFVIALFILTLCLVLAQILRRARLGWMIN